jgi:Protein of unknown function (DUF3006)
MMKGVYDRKEGNKAVILIEEEKAELIIPVDELPSGSTINTIFSVEKRNGSYQIIAIDHEAGSEVKEKTSDLLAKLRAKSSGSKFKKD